MLRALIFFFERHWTILALAGLAVVGARFGFGVTEVMATVLVWFLVYRLNVEERTKKTWDYFSALPLSLPQRAVIKIAMPLVIAVSVLALSEDHLGLQYFLDGDFSSHVLFACVLVLASLMGRSLLGFLGIFVGVYALASVFGNAELSRPIIAGLLLAVAYVWLSGRRASLAKAAVIAAAVAIPVSAGAHFGRLQVYRGLTGSNDANTRIHAAAVLVDEQGDPAAVSVLEKELLSERINPHQVEEILDAFHDAELQPGLERDQWESLLGRGADIRHEVFHHFADDDEAYPWITREVLYGWEPLVFTGGEECEADCEALAELIHERFEEIDAEHYRPLLRSGDPQRVSYALYAVEESETPVLQEELIGLIGSPFDEEVLDILQDWALVEAAQEVTGAVEEVERDLSPERTARLQKFFRKRLKDRPRPQ